MSVVLVALCDHGDRYSTCATRSLPAPAADPDAAWSRWYREGWTRLRDGTLRCPFHSGRE